MHLLHIHKTPTTQANILVLRPGKISHLEHSCPRDMVGMAVRVQAVDELQPKFLTKRRVTLNGLDNRIDQKCLFVHRVRSQTTPNGKPSCLRATQT
jgi:hypothetical protein